MKKGLYLLTILAMLLQPGLAPWTISPALGMSAGPHAPAWPDATSVTQSFMGATAPGWNLLGNAGLTDEDGNGWLRLTPAVQNQAGVAFYTTAFPSNVEFSIDFDYAIWGGDGADGLTFFMIDGAAEPTSPGAIGGGLGYDGIAGGYFAVGFSEYNVPPAQAQIVIFKNGIPPYGVPVSSIPASRTVPNHVHITFYNNHVTVWLAGVKVIADHSWSATLPETVKFGFSAATGYNTNFHEVRNAAIWMNSTIGVLRVSPSGNANMPCGQSWATACAMQTALNYAEAGDEIWAAAGIYKPTSGSDRSATFQLKSGVALYGGFAGTETSREQRDCKVNSTTLSGDLLGDDGENFTNNGDNSYHVVTGSGTDASAILEGFTITGGNANGNDPHAWGGGMYNDTGGPTLTDVTFSANSAGAGGGMYNAYSSPTLTNVTFSANSAISLTLSYGSGGGMYNASESNPTLTNVTFFGNSAAAVGGGVCNSSSSPTLTNVTFSANSAWAGGGMGSLYSAYPTLTNSIVWDNTPDQIVDIGSSSTVITYSAIQVPLYPGEGNINIDPLFVHAASGNLRLRPGSPAIDAGNNAAVPLTVTTDLDGNPRFVDIPGVVDTGIGTPPLVDLGAYEARLSSPVIYVDRDSAGPLRDGTSWATALTSLQSALAAANGANEIWVAAGTYYPGPAGDRLATFWLNDIVALYGGFAGDETSRAQRDPSAHSTLLSGDLDRNGTLDNGNSYHVVTGSGAGASAILDGFTISGGYANGAYPHNNGGGMYNAAGSPTLTNVTFSGNTATIAGGGMYNAAGSPTLTHVTFSGNSAANGGGGGMFNAASSPTLTNVTFSGNSAGAGGGMYNLASIPTLTNVTFYGNSAANLGGGIYNYSDSNPFLTNVTFSGNTASEGGGMYNYADELFNVSSSTLINSIVWGNTPSNSQIAGYFEQIVITYSDIQGGWTGEGDHNIDSDPLFVDAASGNLRLRSSSPAIDAGNNNTPGLSAITTDMDGRPRFVDMPGVVDTGSGTPPIVDMGAYETQLSWVYLPVVRR